MKKDVVRNTIYILLVIFLCIGAILFFNIALNKDTETSTEKEPQLANTSLSLVMVGDSLIHQAVYHDVEGNYDFKPMLSEIKPIISKFDLAYYNQETILGGKDIGLSTYPRFNSPYEVGDAFIDAGFNLVSLANNHTLDRGEQALNNSCNYWKSKNVVTAGSYCSEEDRNEVKIYEKNGIKYALLSYTTTTNGLNIPNGKNYYVNVYNKEKVKEDIEKYRDKVDLLMVAMHWGEEYTHQPVYEQREIAKYLASLNVDIIIGAHPHVVEPIEYIDNTLVIYSLGNFISAQRGIEKLTGLMASVKVTKDQINNKISIDDVEVELLYTYSNENKGYRGNFKVYPYTKLNDNLLPNYKEYYNKYMNIVIGDKDYIKKGDYNGDSK